MQHHESLDVAEFRHLVESLCAAAAADLDATHRRLDRLRQRGADGVDDDNGR
jgi:hypothetical protein